MCSGFLRPHKTTSYSEVQKHFHSVNVIKCCAQRTNCTSDLLAVTLRDIKISDISAAHVFSEISKQEAVDAGENP